MTNKKIKKAKVKLSMDDIRGPLNTGEVKSSMLFHLIAMTRLESKMLSGGSIQPPNKISDYQYEEWYRLGTYIQGLAICCGQLRTIYTV